MSDDENMIDDKGKSKLPPPVIHESAKTKPKKPSDKIIEEPSIVEIIDNCDPLNPPKPWTTKQILFAKAYVGEAECVGTKAAEIAGYEKSSRALTAHRMIRHDNFGHVQDYIREKLGGLFEKYDMSAESLLQRLGEIVHSRLSDVATWTEKGIKLKSPEEINHGALGALKSITEKKGNTDELSVTMHDPIAAMREAAKLQKLYEELDTGIHAQNVNIYLPDNGRADPARVGEKFAPDPHVRQPKDSDDERR